MKGADLLVPACSPLTKESVSFSSVGWVLLQSLSVSLQLVLWGRS